MQADLCLCDAVEGVAGAVEVEVEVDGLLGVTEGDFEIGEVALGVGAGGTDMIGVETGAEEEMDTLGVGANEVDGKSVVEGAEVTDALGTISV